MCCASSLRPSAAGFTHGHYTPCPGAQRFHLIIFLLDMGTVVFLPRATACERDVIALAVGVEMPVDELRAIVAVQTDERHRQPFVDVMNGAADPHLALAPDGLQLDPTGGDVDGAERTEVKALGAAAAMADQVDFEKARPGV